MLFCTFYCQFEVPGSTGHKCILGQYCFDKMHTRSISFSDFHLSFLSFAILLLSVIRELVTLKLGLRLILIRWMILPRFQTLKQLQNHITLVLNSCPHFPHWQPSQVLTLGTRVRFLMSRSSTTVFSILFLLQKIKVFICPIFYTLKN